jgi:hypothetical protein
MNIISLDKNGNITYQTATSFDSTPYVSSYYTGNNCYCFGNNRLPLVSQCTKCNYQTLPPSFNDANQKRIWKASRVDQSQYLDSISAMNVYTPPVLNTKVNWNQMSDRPLPGVVKTNVPSHGNSTKYSITRARPGAQSAPGVGVDVKHGSYHRYLERLKGKGPLRTQETPAAVPIYGNKTKYYGITNNNTCLC